MERKREGSERQKRREVRLIAWGEKGEGGRHTRTHARTGGEDE